MPEEKEKCKEEIEVFPFIEGKIIDLVAQNSKWAELICKWRNDPNVRHYSRNAWPRSLGDVKKRFETIQDEFGHTRDYVGFIIYHKCDKRPIGEIGLNRIDWVSRHANIFAMIGEPEYLGKGIVGEAAQLVLKYAFTELNLHKIKAGVFTPNERSLRAAEKLGLNKEAVVKEAMYVDGKYHDIHKWGLTKEEWLKKN
ncbi:MAG: GNAT family N-acetyltransferase [Candidatus Lokiarchaeota archaeon]|nr:GNAT family N-acetyltransferase [Candidatus Lokiarchaeota archaeon]